MSSTSRPTEIASSDAPVRLRAGSRHELVVVERHARATRISLDRPLRPGATVTLTVEAGTAFQVKGTEFVNGSARPAVPAELRRLRWRVHCGGRFIADTALHEGPLRVTLPERLFGESILAAAYTWEPHVHIFSHWWIPGRSGEVPAGTGTLRSAQQLAQIIRACGKRIPSNVDALYEHLHRGFSSPGMNSTLQQAHFLAQAMHESIGFTALTELITDDAASRKYRDSNGNTGPLDGAAFKGRGIMQITGYDGYRSVFRAYMGDRYPAFRDANAERLWLRREAARLADDPGFAVQAGFHFWATKPVNDRAALDDVLGASIRVNGWVKPARLPNGWEERVRFTQIAKDHLGLRR